jgi:peptide/nickel transport system ATP-binding protein
MFKGEIVEQGISSKITVTPDHPYTKKLLMASPVPDPDRQQQRREARKKLIAADSFVA